MWDPYASTTQTSQYDPALAGADLYSSLGPSESGAAASSSSSTSTGGVPALVPLEAQTQTHAYPHPQTHTHTHTHTHGQALPPIHDYSARHTPARSYSPSPNMAAGTGSSSRGNDNNLDPVTGDRLTAEEKRLRNNSASARFRVKKKMQEKQLVQNTIESAEKLTQLQGKAQELERENKWLKNLVLEKSKVERRE
ncbi:hypothetical protein BROUX41_003627 [Berkeleyomyces rouxiae]|uniref:uncharacterized protein n=1 Tax=Berkeleyomyces rouxiae TaxID=2035830 RepID=UPI003B76A8F4